MDLNGHCNEQKFIEMVCTCILKVEIMAGEQKLHVNAKN